MESFILRLFVLSDDIASEGIAKVGVLWYKKDVFKRLLNELAEIWPVQPLDTEFQEIKDKSLTALRIAHRCE